MQLDPLSIVLGERPLLICDVDDVVLEFVVPFEAYLESRSFRLLPRSFRFHGNIVAIADENAADQETVSALIQGFFAEQERWQTPVEGAVETLAALSRDVDIVFLTAMPPLHYAPRRSLLDRFGFHHPMIAAREAKGPLIHALHRARKQPLAFIDDMAHNLHSVAETIGECGLVHLIPSSEIYRFAPEGPSHASRATCWGEAEALLRQHLMTTDRGQVRHTPGS